MEEHIFNQTKKVILDHVQELLEEMEQEIALSHQEKFAMLEDMLGGANDSGELKVAFAQWFNDHHEEIDFDHDLDEIWAHAIARLED